MPYSELEKQLAGSDLDTRQRSGHQANDNTVLVAYMAHVCGVNRITIYRWKREGLSTMQADRAATAIGLHPLNIWPDWGREEF